MGRTTKAEEKAKAIGKQKAKEAADAAARETLLTLSAEEDGETHDFLASDKDIASDINEFSSDDESNKDIFADIGEDRVKKGDIIKYTIFKYGSQLASVYHPCSWEMIHKKYGDGQYKVLARSHSLNRIVKTQSRMLGQPAPEFTMNGFATPQEETKEASVQTAPQQPGFMEIFSLIMNQQNQVKAEAKEINQSSQQSNNQMMMMFMEMMKSNQAQAMQSQLQTMEMMTRVTEKMSETQTRMFDKINERIEKIAAEKQKAPDIEATIERMQNAQEKGFALYQKFDELSTKKAELQLEMMRGDEDDEDEDDKPEKESLTDTLIKTIIPMMAAGQRQMPQTFQQRPQQRGQLPRRSAPQGANFPSQAVVNRPRTRPPQGATGSASNKAQSSGHIETTVAPGWKDAGESSVVKPKVKMRGSLPEVDVTTVANQEDPFDFSGEEDFNLSPDGTPEVEATGLDETPRTNEEKQFVQDKCREILPKFLGGLMLEGVSADIGAERTINLLLEHELTSITFLTHVSAQDLEGYAKEFSLPEEACLWLNELYANIQTTAGTDVGIQFAKGDEPKFVEGSPG